MSARKPLKVSGLIQAGVVQDSTEDRVFGAANGQPLQASTDSQAVPISLIDDSPFQPRMLYDPAEIDNLAHSLAAAGLEDAITVRMKDGGRFELISGHRRVRAARSLGWPAIEARIVSKTDRQAELATMVQNEARVDLTDFERGKLYQTAMTSGFGKTQSDVANLFGTTQGRVSRCMAILKLPDTYLQILEAKPDLFGYSCAEQIMQLLKEFPNDILLVEEAVRRIDQEGADQKSVRQWVVQMVKQKNGVIQQKPRAVVTDRAGREIFVVKPTGRELTVQIKANDVDQKEIEELILAALRQHAEKEAE